MISRPVLAWSTTTTTVATSAADASTETTTTPPVSSPMRARNRGAARHTSR